MTMPHERTRSLRWGFEFLGEMLSDETIDESIRATAQRLLLTYPRPEQIFGLIEADEASLSMTLAQALVDANELWTRLQVSGQGNEGSRHTLKFVQRHFPEPWLSEMLARAPVDGLRRWLLPEDHEYGRDIS